MWDSDVSRGRDLGKKIFETSKFIFPNSFVKKYLVKIFRSVVLVVISIVRMKYLVRRWHSGVRIAEKVNSRHYRHHKVKLPETTFPAQFQVGQPVSSQFFSNNASGHYGATGPNNFFQTDEMDAQENAAFGYNDGKVSPAGSTRSHLPWSGNTPPSKEGSEKRRIRIG